MKNEPFSKGSILKALWKTYVTIEGLFRTENVPFVGKDNRTLRSLSNIGPLGDTMNISDNNIKIVILLLDINNYEFRN